MSGLSTSCTVRGPDVLGFGHVWAEATGSRIGGSGDGDRRLGSSGCVQARGASARARRCEMVCGDRDRTLDLLGVGMGPQDSKRTARTYTADRGIRDSQHCLGASCPHRRHRYPLDEFLAHHLFDRRRRSLAVDGGLVDIAPTLRIDARGHLPVRRAGCWPTRPSSRSVKARSRLDQRNIPPGVHRGRGSAPSPATGGPSRGLAGHQGRYIGLSRRTQDHGSLLRRYPVGGIGRRSDGGIAEAGCGRRMSSTWGAA